MVKIKQKVELEPKAFLKHLLEKEETEVELDGYAFDGSNYLFGPEVTVNEYVSYNPNKNTYTVEIEEEIDEHTKIPVLVEVYKLNENLYGSTLKHNISVSVEKDGTSVAFYMLNDDMTMTLIWRNGGMVE
ncbi:hypothetical protein [Staphylococcus chromogenes]|uniref:hypothetical protein n=1 Tax=Staphylococcus chromogenes TaxID=46126 RepID=UPI00227AD89C|nr:hypothetical protein [Staphylococcus chromogenes]WAG30172.1 hypothetical protein LGV34_08685 [Staphylococcus chromogenes]